MKKKDIKLMTCKDYTVSNETFELILDEKLDMLRTSPKPNKEALGKYYESTSYISHTDANESLFDKVYQIVKNYTIKRKVRLLDSLGTEDKKILDIGCGTGDFLEACKNKQWKISGLEPNENARSLAIKKTETVIHTNIEELIEGYHEPFDVISMWHVLEHVADLNEYIGYLKKLLKPNGTLIVAVPNFKSYDAAYYGEFWAAYDVPRHLWHFSQKSIGLVFKDFDLEVVKTLPMKFDAYYVSLLSEKYMTSKSNPVKAFYRGFISNLKAKQNNEYSSLIYLIKNKK